MIDNPIVFDAESVAVIQQLNNDVKSWEDDRVIAIRGKIKDHYLKEQQYKCCYCSCRIATSNARLWDAEHILPKINYPQFTFESRNLAVSCPDCNLAKSDKNILVNPKRKTFPGKSEDYTIPHPHFDEIYRHVSIYPGKFYAPKTEKGKNIIYLCDLLRYSYRYINYIDEMDNSDVGNILIDLAKGILDGEGDVKSKAIYGSMLIRDVINGL